MKNDVKWIAGVGWSSKIITALQQLLLVKLLIFNIGDAGYSGFVLVYGLMLWFQLTDLGYGFASQNRITISNNSTDRSLCVRNSIITTLLLSVAFSVLILFNLNEYFFQYIAKVTGLVRNQTDYLFYNLMPLVFIASLSGFVVKICFSTGDGMYAHLYTLLNSSAGFFSVIVIEPTSLYDSLLSFYLPQSILTIFVMLALWKRHGDAKINVKEWIDFTKKLIKPALTQGTFAILGAAVLQIDFLILSQYCASKDIVEYSTVYKIYGVAVFVISALLQANWTIITKLYVGRDFQKIVLIARRIIFLGFVLVIAYGFSFLLFENSVMEFFGVKAGDGSVLIVLLMLYFLCRVVSDTFAMIMQSTDNAKYLIFVVVIQAAISVPLQVYLGERYAVIGISISLILTFTTTSVWMLPYFFYKKCKT